MDVYPQRPVYIIIISSSNSVIKLAKLQRVATTSSSSFEIIYIKIDESFPYSPSSTFLESANVVRYKPTPDRPQDMGEYKTVQQMTMTLFRNDTQEEVTIVDRVERDHPEFLTFLKESLNMWDGHLGRSRSAKHRIKLVDSNVHPAHCASYSAVRMARWLAAAKIDEMNQEGVI